MTATAILLKQKKDREEKRKEEEKCAHCAETQPE